MPPANSNTLSLFLTLARRPHTTKCLLRPHPYETQRLASTKTSKLPSPNPKPSSNTTAAAAAAAAASPVSKIPLFVGLDRNPTQLSAFSRIPIPRGIRGENFTPAVLSRPLGLTSPPLPGQNSPYDTRSLSERKEEFTNYTKALERRRVYLRSYLRPYYQEWRRMDFHKGKSFQSNERMFKREKALWFPNLVGWTLTKGSDGQEDSVGIMRGNISVVGMHSGLWAEEQVQSFLGRKENGDLKDLVDRSQGKVQMVNVNMQSDWFKLWLVRLFKGRLRRSFDKEEWGRYFIVKLPRDIRRGLTEEDRDAMGLLNSQVGYVYLVDSECRIRWAGSAFAWEGEREGLNRAVQRLLVEEAELKRGKLVVPATGGVALKRARGPKAQESETGDVLEAAAAAA